MIPQSEDDRWGVMGLDKDWGVWTGANSFIIRPNPGTEMHYYCPKARLPWGGI